MLNKFQFYTQQVDNSGKRLQQTFIINLLYATLLPRPTILFIIYLISIQFIAERNVIEQQRTKHNNTFPKYIYDHEFTKMFICEVSC